MDKHDPNKMDSFSEALTSPRAARDRIATQTRSSLQPNSLEQAQREEYAAAVSLIILEVYTLFDLPLPESTSLDGMPSEQERVISIWTNALIRTVPANELYAALDYAIDHHTKDRAINAMDIKQNYGAMIAERQGRAEDGQQRAEALSDCRSCDNARTKEIWFPSSGESVTLPCQSCRPQAFATAREQWLERRGGEAPPAGSIELVKKAAEELVSQAEH
ncbi:MAG TPA: hypothetical protein VJS44_04730 [Pyrinomonadaceae bacterium]|nr:hypothetical protein [Pyrinomonadaceae bacterium]